jgi:DNA-binding transcriptional ArsR family regulator
MVRSLYLITLTLDKILSRLDTIDAKLLLIPQIQVLVNDESCMTLRALKALKRGTASEVCRVTGKRRATESRHLNELVREGLLLKSREGKRLIFEERLT